MNGNTDNVKNGVSDTKRIVDMNASDEELMRLAEEARLRSYCPYSGYSVGAALLCSDGTVYLGSNVENSSFGAAICAERVSAVSAVNDGRRDFVRIAVAGGKQGEKGGDCTPCGICRQFLSEFCDNSFSFVIKKDGRLLRLGVLDMLPHGFKLS